MIGICNGADPQDHEGIFASLPVIHWELDKIGQREVYDPQGAANLAAAPRPSAASPRGAMLVQDTAAGSPVPREMPSAQLAIDSPGGDTEIICIVRSRNNPQGSEQLLVFDRPSRELLDRLANESRRKPTETVALNSNTSVDPQFAGRDRDRYRDNSSNRNPGQNPIVRAQSTDR